MTNRSGSGASQSGKSGSKPGDPGKTRSSPSTTHLSLREELEKAAADLSYTSESDSPFRFFTLPAGSETGLTAQGFLNCIGLSQELIDELNVPIDQLIEERTLDDFFPSIDDLAAYYGADTSDPEVMSKSKQFRELEAVIRKRLRDVKVLRVGRVEVQCFIAGLDEHGDIAGLVTMAVET